MNLARTTVQALLVAAVMLAAGTHCGHSEGPATSTPPEPGDAGEALSSTRTQSGTLVLPRGLSIDVSSCTVISSLDAQPISASGAFSLTTFDIGPELVLALADGGLLLMGYLDAQHGTIDVTSTATALTFVSMGGPLMRSTDAAQVLSLLPAAAPVASFAQAITSALVTDPHALAATTPNATLAGAMPTYTALVSADILSTPGTQSGVTVVQSAPYAAYLQNVLRRRGWAYVQRTAEIDANGTRTPYTTPIDVVPSGFELKPAVPLQGSLTGTLTDIFNASFGAQAVWGPVSSPQTSTGDTSPFALAITPMSARTEYTVTVVGPAGHAGVIAQLGADMQAKQSDVAARAYAFDLISPIIANVILGGNVFDKTSYTGNQPTPVGCTVVAFSAAIAQDLYSQITTVGIGSPSLLAQISTGDWRGAFLTTATSGILWAALQAAADFGANTGCLQPTTTLRSLVTKIAQALSLVGAGLQIFDSGKMALDILSADRADQWTVTSLQSTVRINPIPANVGPGGSLPLTAFVSAPVIDGGAPFAYLWSNTQTAGVLSGPGSGTMVPAPDGGPGASYCSSSANSTYTANATFDGGTPQDTVALQVFDTAGCKGTLLGDGYTTVNVQAGCPFDSGTDACVVSCPGGLSTSLDISVVDGTGYHCGGSDVTIDVPGANPIDTTTSSCGQASVSDVPSGLGQVTAGGVTVPVTIHPCQANIVTVTLPSASCCASSGSGLICGGAIGSCFNCCMNRCDSNGDCQ